MDEDKQRRIIKLIGFLLSFLGLALLFSIDIFQLPLWVIGVACAMVMLGVSFFSRNTDDPDEGRCPYCGKGYIVKHGDQKFCSNCYQQID